MVVVAHFLRWIDTARVCERAAAAAALARAYIDGTLEFEDRCAAEAALTLLLDDPSSKVRLAMAEALSMSRKAPPQIIAALAADQLEVATLVLGRSPLLTDADLIDRFAVAPTPVQCVVAGRAWVGISLAAAIAEVGEAEACIALLQNPGADIAAVSFRRMVERFGDRADLREAMLGLADLPSDCRHLLLVQLGETLGRSPFLLGVMGEARAARMAREACTKASLTLIDRTRSEEHPALIEHLRLRGELTTGFLLRSVAAGKIDFFGAALVALTNQSDRHVGALLARGRDVALCALMRSAGLPTNLQPVITSALAVWRDVANGKRVAGTQEVTWEMLQALKDDPTGEAASLIRRIHLEALRENARHHARAIAAA
ncbi:DUF2336 domain-containing protein [Tianweitania sp.]|uniref:DUF2336 domain-containing protein n=1 Tax=Tianweitania sp. TaxID=2021634 RepID=UPI00289B81CE|nr:DUF2336 domain-containing protein [Tianweitania sp.]